MQKHKSAFTLMELLLVIALIAVFFAVGSQYMFRNHAKNVLYTKTEELADYLKLAQQKSISAERGIKYGVKFVPAEHKYLLLPENKVIKLSQQIKQMNTNRTEIYFDKLTGKPDNNLQVELFTSDFKTRVTVNEQGIVEFSKPEKI